MLKYCQAADDDSVRDFERGVCTGFIDGFAAGHHAAELWHAFHHREETIDNIYGHLCVPRDTNRTALVTLFVRYLENHPDNLNWNAGLLLEAALRDAYPCPEED
ncbi:MAG: Rap1a/Tai family immunity protein [Burkholderiales bacterium]